MAESDQEQQPAFIPTGHPPGGQGCRSAQAAEAGRLMVLQLGALRDALIDAGPLSVTTEIKNVCS